MSNADSDPLLHTQQPPTQSAGLVYWFALMVALLTLVFLSTHVYQWLRSDVDQRRSKVQAELAKPDTDLGAVPDDPTHGNALPALTTQAPNPNQDEPAAPAVLGQTIHKCLQDGRLIYTNQACPEGSASSSSSVIPSGAAHKSTWAGRNQGSQHAAQCDYLQAEIGRLEFEFRQALPPAVIDHISTELGTLRQQRSNLACPEPAQPSP